MSNVITSFAPTFSPYNFDGQFSFSYNEEYGFDSTLSPNMTRYLHSPTPSSVPEGGSAESEIPHSYSYTDTNQLQSPQTFDMSNLSIRSPTALLPQAQSQPIPVNQPPYHLDGHSYASPNMYGYSNGSSSLPHRSHGHAHLPLYSPYSRPDTHGHLPFRSPPSSSHSANSGPQSSDLVSPYTLGSPMTDTSPIPNYYNQAAYAGSPLHSYTGMQIMTPSNYQPRGLLLEGAGGGHIQGVGSIPQHPPVACSGGKGRGKVGKGRGGMAIGVRKKGSREVQIVDPDIEGNGGGDDDMDGEGESIAEDTSNGTHKSFLEKRRRSVLKQNFATLAAQLPKLSDTNSRDTKLNTLDRAATYIETLKSSLQFHLQEAEKAKVMLEIERAQKIQAQALADDLARSLAQQTCKKCKASLSG